MHLIRNSLDYATPYLLPPSVEDWLPKDHLARFVVDIVDQLDLSALTRQYRGTGSAAYHPTLMLGLLIYGYATGVYSSRRIEAATHESIAFRYIAANAQPDHDSLCSFRKRFLKEIEVLFVQVCRQPPNFRDQWKQHADQFVLLLVAKARQIRQLIRQLVHDSQHTSRLLKVQSFPSR